MRRNTQLIAQFLYRLVMAIVPLTILLYILRGIGWFGFFHGGWLLFLLILSIFSVIFWLISLTY